MPAFNIPCTHKYLVVKGIEQWTKCNKFSHAKKIAIDMGATNEIDKYDTITIYERLGKGKTADWYPLVDYYNGHFDSLVLGNLLNDNE